MKPHKPDHYHQTTPPCELKSVVMGRQNSKKKRRPSASDDAPSTPCRLQGLFNHMLGNHGLTLLEGEMHDLIEVVRLAEGDRVPDAGQKVEGNFETWWNSRDSKHPLGTGTKNRCKAAFEGGRKSAEGDGWLPIDSAPMNTPIWLYEEDRGVLIGGKEMVDSETWLWGNCYNQYWHTGVSWKCDIEADDDYKPTFYKLLPNPPTE